MIIKHLSLTEVTLEDHKGIPLGYDPKSARLKYRAINGTQEGQILSVRLINHDNRSYMQEFFCK